MEEGPVLENPGGQSQETGEEGEGKPPQIVGQTAQSLDSQGRRAPTKSGVGQRPEWRCCPKARLVKFGLTLMHSLIGAGTETRLH